MSNIPIHSDSFRAAQWRMLLATMFCYVFYYLGRQTFGFAIPGIQEELNISKTTLGWAATCLLWSYAIGQAINGNLGDKFGGRRMMSIGAVLSCVLNWTVSCGVSVKTLIVPWTLNGYAQSMGWAPGSRLLSNWWGQHERGRVYGFYVFAAGLSSVLSFVMPLVVLELGLGWRSIFRLPVSLLLVGGVVFYLVARDRPQDFGFDSPTDIEPSAVANDESSTTSSHSEVSESSFRRYQAVLTNRRFMIASWAIGFQNAARYALLFWVPVHFLGKDWKDARDAWVSVALPVGMAIGALASGWLSDRLFESRRGPLISIFMTLASISSFAMYFVPKDQYAIGMSVLFLCGFFVYGSQSAFWALCPDLLGHTRAGTGTGVMNFHAYFFAGISEPLIGRMIETHKIVGQSGNLVDNTGLVFLVVGAACMVSAVISLFIRR